MESSFDSRPCVSFKFEVEKIIDISSDGNYQVQWAPAWVNKFHLVGCEHLIEEFLLQQAEDEIKIEPEIQYQLPHDVPSIGSDIPYQPELDVQYFVEPSTSNMEIDANSTDFEMHKILTAKDPCITEISAATGLMNTLPSSAAFLEHHQQPCTLDVDKDNSGCTYESLEYELGVNRKVDVQEKCSKTIGNSWKNSVEQSSDINLTRTETKDLIHEVEPTLPSRKLQLHDTKQKTDTPPKQTYRQHPALPCKGRLRKGSGGKRFECMHCKKKFKQRAHLTRHIRTHTGERPYSCDFCDYSASVKYNLTLHLRNHTGEKPYYCEVCGEFFKRRDSLTHHLSSHTGETPFACAQCGQRFTQKCNLKSHNKRFHPEQ